MMARCPKCEEELEFDVVAWVIFCKNQKCDWQVMAVENAVGPLARWAWNVTHSINDASRMILLRSPQPPEEAE